MARSTGFTVRFSARQATRVRAVAATLGVPARVLVQEAVTALLDEAATSTGTSTAARTPRRTRKRIEDETEFEVLWTPSMRITPAEALKRRREAQS